MELNIFLDSKLFPRDIFNNPEELEKKYLKLKGDEQWLVFRTLSECKSFVMAIRKLKNYKINRISVGDNLDYLSDLIGLNEITRTPPDIYKNYLERSNALKSKKKCKAELMTYDSLRAGRLIGYLIKKSSDNVIPALYYHGKNKDLRNIFFNKVGEINRL